MDGVAGGPDGGRAAGPCPLASALADGVGARDEAGGRASACWAADRPAAGEPQVDAGTCSSAVAGAAGARCAPASCRP